MFFHLSMQNIQKKRVIRSYDGDESVFIANLACTWCCISLLRQLLLQVTLFKHQNGSHEQKLKYLPKACSGEIICGMGMSEPGAGTDVMGMSTTATKSSDGSYYTINGAKMWITNGTIHGAGDTGDAFLVYAKTGTGRGAKDITSFLVDKV